MAVVVSAAAVGPHAGYRDLRVKLRKLNRNYGYGVPTAVHGRSTVISSGVGQPRGIAMDSFNDLFVANGSNNTITAYAPPYTGMPYLTIPGSHLGGGPYGVFLRQNVLFVTISGNWVPARDARFSRKLQ